MEIINLATQWAKDEIYSSKFFIIIGIFFIATAIGFWHLGKSEYAKSYFIPFLVCGLMLLIIGSGLCFNNKKRLKEFAIAYERDNYAFVQSEIERTENTIKQTNNTIFKLIPMLIIAAALIIIFSNNPTWRAASIVAIAFLIVLLIVDSNSYCRIVDYHRELQNL